MRDIALCNVFTIFHSQNLITVKYSLGNHVNKSRLEQTHKITIKNNDINDKQNNDKILTKILKVRPNSEKIFYIYTPSIKGAV